MKEFYSFIRSLDLTQKTTVMTVLEGKYAAEKAVQQNGQFIWKEEGGFFAGIGANGGDEFPEFKDGIFCIDNTRIFLETPGSRKHMVICGGGNVSLYVIRLAKMADFYVTVLEDRLTFADQAREAGADEVILDRYAQGLKKVPGGPDDYFVIVTRGHRYDEECLSEILSKPFAYVGMMGSRKRADMVRSRLPGRGISSEKAAVLHAPIGLSINAQTPAEIAVSIMAEIIAVKNKNGTREGYPEKILDALIESPGPLVLMTIIEKKGSAPRSVGTRMLLLPDDTTIGTIGGGCMEAEILSAARILRAQFSERTGCQGSDISKKQKPCLTKI